MPSVPPQSRTADSDLPDEDKTSNGDLAPSRRRAALTQVVLAYISLGVSIITNLGLMPMYLRHIDGHLYGLWLASGGILTWLGLMDLGVAGVMGQRVAAAYGRRNYREVGRYYFNAQVFQVLLMFVLVAASAMMGWKLPRLIGAGADEQQILGRAVFLAGLAMGLMFMNNGQHNTAGALQRPLVTMLSITSGRILGVTVTVVLLLRSYGLVALPIGLLVGAAFTLIVNLFYVTRLVRGLGGKPEWNRHVFDDILRLSPAVVAAKIGDALVGQIEPVLIAIMIAPEAAIVFTLTKRAADTIENILDRITGSVTAGFAHLYAEGDVRRAGEVLNIVCSISLAVGVICLAAYVALNHSFIRLWVGERYFAGGVVTLLVAMSAATQVFGNLFSMLLGATGDIAVPSVTNVIEAICRLALMALLLSWFGMVGLPLATIVSCGGMTYWLARRIRFRLGCETCMRISGLEGALFSVVALGAAGVGAVLLVERWESFIVAVAVVVGVTAAVVTAVQPALRTRLRAIVAAA
jgi:O-antigen/teichoic acid export membrane protein